MFNILAFRAKVVCTSQQVPHKKMEHIRKALPACNFPTWVLNSLQNKFNCKHNIHNGQTTTDNQSSNNNNKLNNKNIPIVVPYMHVLGKRFKKTCNNLGIQMHFKGSNTIKTLLMAPKDRENKLQESGVIYRSTCPHITCPKKYIGEAGRTFGNRLKEHLIHHHSHSTGYPVSPKCFTIVDRESQGVTRNIKEAMYICVNDPSLNRSLESINSQNYGMKFKRTHYHFTSNNTALPPTPYMG